jgi:hypothetical protein
LHYTAVAVSSGRLLPFLVSSVLLVSSVAAMAAVVVVVVVVVPVLLLFSQSPTSRQWNSIWWPLCCTATSSGRLEDGPAPVCASEIVASSCFR